MRRSEWSDVKEGDLLNLRVENYAYSGKPHPRTAAELEALAALFGDRFGFVPRALHDRDALASAAGGAARAREEVWRVGEHHVD